MKAAFKIALVLILAVAIGGLVFVVAEIQEGISYDVDSVESVGSVLEVVSEDIDSVTVKKKGAGDFKVVMFTDTHFNGKDNENIMTATHIVENVTREKPDLVIFGGDNISSALSYKRTTEFAQLMENLGVYWVAVIGNHDGEGVLTYSRKEIIDLYASYDHCLVVAGPEDIDGYGNFTVNILNDDDTLKEVFFLMDSGDYMSKEYKEKYDVGEDESHYDGVKESQVQWYKDKHDAIEAEYGKFKSITVIHIPPYQTKELADAEYLYGDRREGICQSGFDTGLFAALKEKRQCSGCLFRTRPCKRLWC